MINQYKVYCVSLDKANKDVENEIMKFNNWAHYISNTWLIRSIYNAEYIYQRLSKFLGNDRILISEINPNNYHCNLPESCRKWLNDK